MSLTQQNENVVWSFWETYRSIWDAFSLFPLYTVCTWQAGRPSKLRCGFIGVPGSSVHGLKNKLQYFALKVADVDFHGCFIPSTITIFSDQTLVHFCWCACRRHVLTQCGDVSDMTLIFSADQHESSIINRSTMTDCLRSKKLSPNEFLFRCNEACWRIKIYRFFRNMINEQWVMCGHHIKQYTLLPCFSNFSMSEGL